MIYSIQRFYKPELTNDLHDEFMQECASILLSLGKTGNEMFENLKNRFSRAFAEEEKWFKNTPPPTRHYQRFTACPMNENMPIRE